MPFALVTLGLVSLLAISIYFLRRSLRGRPIGDHPTCSRCSFDLFNRPETSTRCPECGSDLTSPRAILPGTRRRSPAFILASLTLLLLTLAASVNLAYRLVVDPRLIPFQPTFLLPFHFSYGPLAPQALAELQSRILTGRAPASAASRVIPHILALQADPKVKWNPAHGTFIELLQQSSLLPAADWNAYLRQCATFAARIRPNVRIGDPVPVELMLTTRVGTNRAAGRGPTGTFSINVTFDDQPSPPPSRPNPRARQNFLSSYTSRVRYNAFADVYASLSPGLHTAHVTTTFFTGLPGDPPVILRQSFDLPVTLHPADHPTVRILDDPTLRNQVAQAILIDVSADYFSTKPVFRMFAPGSPCALAYDVTFRSGTNEYGSSSFTFTNASSGNSTVAPNSPSPIPAHVDLILHPNPDLAAATLDITEICAGDIILPNVPTAPTRSYTPTPILPPLPTTRP